MDSTDIRWLERKENIDLIYATFEKIKKQYPNDMKMQEKALKDWYKSLPDGEPAKRQNILIELKLEEYSSLIIFQNQRMVIIMMLSIL